MSAGKFNDSRSNTKYRSNSNRGGSDRSRFNNRNNTNNKRLGDNSFQTFSSAELHDGATSRSESFESKKLEEQIDLAMGFDRFEAGPSKIGWLINMHSSNIQESEGSEGISAVNLYFLGDDGENFKATVNFDPYFLVGCRAGMEADVEEFIRRKFEGLVKNTSQVQKEDLNMQNHIVGIKRTFVKISFSNVNNLLSVRRELMPLAEKNRKMLDALDVYADAFAAEMDIDAEFNEFSSQKNRSREVDVTDYIIDVREYDVPYHVRVSIDMDIRIGKWYTVDANSGKITVTEMPERLARPDPVVFAFDIETTKLPLKFPDVLIDQIMMISYMIDGQGFLITNREIVSQDIDDFEYTPKPEYEGVFTIFNEANEKALIERFFEHVKEARPTVMVTYNGDFFDWPFVEGRAAFHGINMYQEIGFKKDSEDEYKSAYCAHMDCFRWVKRDSYLPQGSQGLKAVTTAKMGYDPIELDPELMTRYAAEKPQTLSEYSVSDAVATYYLYMKYVHPFVFSLCNIIPLNPDEVLRKGTGTLCEMLLMVQAYIGGIVLPNKHKEPDERFYNGHLIESETYVGGHVESLEAGVFRSDLPVNFTVDPATVEKLLNELDAALKFCIEVENQKSLDDVVNYDEVKQKIARALTELKENPKRKDCPKIYHLDVSSMYPNIMITNRLQPDSMISEADCASCDFNRPGKSCDRRLPWMWRGEFYPAKKDEYNMIKRTLSTETFPGRFPGQPSRSFSDLPMSEQNSLVKKRLSDYSRKIYHKIKETKTVEKEAIICQRENPFYADTVRDFRDRRYEYKNKHKLWKRNLENVNKEDSSAKEEAKKMIVLFDSLQLAHKCILNSFYGYVMRKGSRWYSMEMAGVTCLTGATIIQMARALVEKLGRPLELDTDGIWCILPEAFPEDFKFELKDGKKLFISYPCVMLNHLVHDRFTNNQYQTLIDAENFEYQVKSENSIFFEVDGPYRAMILPTSKEEDKNLKKRYAVFNDDGSLAELKGFEVKRRGELKLIKIFQSQIFKVFLQGSTLEECYGHVAAVSNRWLDIIDSKGSTLAEDELIDLICENRSMSRTLEDYGTQKSTSISTARRLAEFLGEQMVKDKGLACKYIISEKPFSSPVTERAVPVAIFSADESVKSHFLRRWLRDGSLNDFDPRNIIDWDYYRERLSSVIQKIITIPAALQKVSNPVPRVKHPEWLHKRIARMENSKQQVSMNTFKLKPMIDVTNIGGIGDLEDVGSEISTARTAAIAKSKAQMARVISKRKHQQTDVLAESIDQMFATLPAEMPNISNNYADWLDYQKQKWKVQRQARQRRKQVFGRNSLVHSSRHGINGFYQNQAEVAYSKQWHVIQLRPSDTPGKLKCWIAIENRIYQVALNVPKTIFIDFKSTDLPNIMVNDMIIEKVNHTLPSGNNSNMLYKISMKEEFYAEQEQSPLSILNHHSVGAIYESQVDSVTRVVLNLGNACNIDMTKEGALGRGLESGFSLGELVKSNIENDYLSRLESLKFIFIYHVVLGDRQIYAILSTFDDEAEVHVLETSSKQQPQFPNMHGVYQEQLKQVKECGQISEDFFKVKEKVNFTLNVSTNLKKIKKTISARLNKLSSDSNHQAMVAVFSPRPEYLEREFSTLRDLPILRFDSSVTDQALPSLGWQLPLARRIALQFIGLGSRIKHLLNLSRYSSIPLGNIRGNDARYLIDVQYARRLRDANVVLWWSPTPYADHGGVEKDYSLLTTENMDMPVLNNAGSFNAVCVEIAVKNLAINTVLTSALINEMEGADAHSHTVTGTGSNTDTASISFLENASSAPAIAVLRDLVKKWWEDALKQNLNADIMVNVFVSWVSSSSSFLYDPVLQYHMRNLSRKAFLQLNAEFRRVGSSIVYADQNKLVMQTSKMVVGNAYAYSQYIIKALRSKPLFGFLDLEISKYWDYLLWMDNFNYGGFSCTEVVQDELQTYELQMTWQLKSYLPPVLQQEFHSWVQEFMEHMHTAKMAEFRTSQTSSTPRPTQLRVQRGEDDYFGKGIVSGLQKPLRKRIQQLMRKQLEVSTNEVAAAEFAFPVLPGSHLKYSNPSLELVKSLCAVITLARESNFEVRVLRRDLLSLFEVKEFSDAGIFKNPSTSLTISEICSQCGAEYLLDFCKDETLRTFETSDNDEPGRLRALDWACRSCKHEYDRLEIEERMISDVQTLVTKFQVQDLRCAKCKQIRGSNLSAHCACSGAWELTMPADEIRRALVVYNRISEYYGLRMLHGMVEAVGKI
ncbi:hypothetical protein V1514DRAFT_330928 [Lipomyces japonicus]|uniref:uncharacterized protein n=1 Tax=Lipomyces japonicus TaxID=56871 RepID=UPI0034CF1CDD